MSNTIIGEKVLNDAHLKQQLQILRQADNWTNLYYIAMIYIYLAAVISSTLMFYYQPTLLVEHPRFYPRNYFDRCWPTSTHGTGP